MKSQIRNQKPTVQTREFSCFPPSASKVEMYLIYPSHQSWVCHHHSLFQVWRLLFVLNGPEQISSSASSTPPAPFTGAFGKRFLPHQLCIFNLLIILCRERNSGFKTSPMSGLGSKSLSRFPPSSLPAPCHPSSPSSTPAVSSLSLPETVKASLCPLIFVGFCCHLILIRFQIPQIRACESNAGSYWVQKGVWILRHFYSVQPLWSQHPRHH